MRDMRHDALTGRELGAYKLLKLIGVGAFGAVYMAEHNSLRSKAAIKVLDPRSAADKVVLERFYREARATARHNHPNIVKVYHVDELQGFHYSVMELAEGGTLADQLRSAGGVFPSEKVLSVTRDVLAGLAVAHESGQVHRDVSLRNVIFSSDGTAKLCDFGLVKLLGEGSLTDWGERLGSAYFMSPEGFIDGHDLTKASDIWSCGVAMYYMAAGQAPFGGTTFKDVSRSVTQMDLDITEISDPRIRKLLRAFLQKKPGDRPVDGIKALELLDQVVRDWHDRPVPPPPKPHSESVPTVPKSVPETRRTVSPEESRAYDAIGSLGVEGIARCVEFLRDFPHGSRSDRVKRHLSRLESEFWAATDQSYGSDSAERNFRHYLDLLAQFAPVEHRDAAEEAIQQILQDDAAWKQARTENKPGALIRYLDDWVNRRGRHIQPARDLLAVYDESMWRKVVDSAFDDDLLDDYIWVFGKWGRYQSNAEEILGAPRSSFLPRCTIALPVNRFALLDGLGAGSLEARKLQQEWVSKGYPLEVKLKGTDIRFRLIPPGSFMMGSPDDEEGRSDSEGPVHRVTISKPIYMAVTEITQGQWQKVMGNNPSNWKGNDLPVEKVSWQDCQEFIKKLRSSSGAIGLRLPSEAEWEYACRAGTKDSRYGELDAIAWYDRNSGGKTNLVGKKLPNGFGLYDMIGNVWEWCEDNLHDNYDGAPADGKAWLGGDSARVLRGGGWSSSTRSCRSANRGGYEPGRRYDSSGFRVALDLP